MHACICVCSDPGVFLGTVRILLVSPLSVSICPMWAYNMVESGWDLHI